LPAASIRLLKPTKLTKNFLRRYDQKSPNHRINWTRLLQQQQPDDYIIASGETHSVKELVECAFHFVGLNSQDYVVVDPAFYRPDESVQLVGNIDKIHNQLGWKPQYSLFF
jgi:GDP-D-mannose dehydratase